MKWFRFTIADYSGKVYFATDDRKEAEDVLETWFDEDFRSRKELEVVESI